MAAQKIRSANANGLPRCKSEGTLIDFSSGVPDPNLNDVKVLSPSSLLINDPASLENVKEVVAIKDYCPNNFTTLKFSKGEHLYVLDTSGGDWWYAHNTTEMGYIPSAYVQPLNYRDSCLSDSGMIDGLLESVDEGVKELDLLGDWNDFLNQNSIKTHNNNPFMRPSVSNPFLNGPLSSSQNVTPDTKSSVDLLLFDPLTTSNVTSTETSTDILLDLHPHTGHNQNVGEPTPARRENPFFRSKRSYSLSELSVLQAKSDSPATGSFFAGLKSPAPEQFQSREDFRTAWLNHRKLARSCHDLDMLGQNPGWGQTQPVETSIVCRLDSSGGAVQLPDTNISILVPEGHVAGTETQQISLKALLDPPLELNNDKCTTVSPVLEVKLSNMEVQTSLTLEVKVSVELHSSIASMSSVKINCLRSDAKEGPYTLMPQTYIYGDTVQVKLDNLEPVMYLVMVAQGQHIVPPSTVWEYISKKVTVGLYGPKHMHPLFKAVVAIFGHDCAPKTLLVSEVAQQINSAPVTLHLWGKQQFVLPRPQDIKMCLFSNMTNYRVEAGDQGKMVRGFQLKLGKVSRLIFPISCQDPAQLSDFTLRVQVRDELGNILSQYCVQTPQPPPKAGVKSTGPRRFLKKKEVGRIVLSPLAVTYKYPTFQDRPISNMKYGKLLKTVIRQSKNQYLLEYKKGDVVGILSEEKIRLKGQLWTKEWYIGYYQGKVGLIHAKNVLVVGKVKPNYFSGPELTTSSLMEQILRPCKFLTYIYASVRTHLMENIGSWRAFADALGYGNLPLSYFCRVEVESEPERVASVLEKLKEECNNNEGKERKSFQKELIAALLKIDCQGLVVRLIQDFVLLTTAVEVAQRWRELAEKLSKVSKQQMDGYEAPHRDRNGMLDSEAMWKPAYDFLLTWSSQMGDSYRDVIQELHTGLDRMRNPITKRWKHLTGTLIFVNSLEILRAIAFSTHEEDDCVI